MDDNRYNGDEPNVEGLVGEFISRMPWDDPQACRDILQLLMEESERLLAHRAARIKRETDEAEADQDD